MPLPACGGAAAAAADATAIASTADNFAAVAAVITLRLFFRFLTGEEGGLNCALVSLFLTERRRQSSALSPQVIF
jgi:hypothetical protein